MVGELEIIFRLDPVPGKLRIPRHRLVFFQKLGGIAALAIILPIAVRTIGHSLGTLSTAATTTAALTIVDQESFSLSHRAPASASAL